MNPVVWAPARRADKAWDAMSIAISVRITHF